MSRLCPNCESPIDGANSLCRYCYAHYKREQRKIDPIAKEKQYARNKAIKALNDGLIFKHDCVSCGSTESQMHHPDYSKPLDVIWLCVDCHSEIHTLERKAYAACGNF